MTTCRWVMSFLDDYLDGVLEPTLVERFEKHVACCEQCQPYIDNYKNSRELARQVLRQSDGPSEMADPPADLVEAIVRAHLEGGQEPPSA